MNYINCGQLKFIYVSASDCWTHFNIVVGKYLNNCNHSGHCDHDIQFPYTLSSKDHLGENISRLTEV